MPELIGSIVPSSTLDALPYPGRIVKRKEKDKQIVESVQRRLNELGCGPVDVDGDFGDQTEKAVKLFQVRFPDSDGHPLTVDGEIGSITWARIFGTHSVPVTNVATTDLLGKVLEAARGEIGTMEDPLGSNRGPRVDQYLSCCGLNPASGHFPWCAGFVYFCYNEATKTLGRSNPVVKTGGVLAHWNKAGQQGIARVTANQAMNNPSLVKPGHIFIMDFGKGAGHTGLVEQVTGGKLVTIEGNTNDGGSREGIGVFRRTQRKVVQVNKGFIEYE
jgi:hypothetical protein